MAEKNCRLCFHYDVCYAVGRMTERAESCAKYTPDVVEVKHGEWVEYPSDAYMKCSVCGMEYAKEKMPNIVGYCPNPNCGAKMDGGKKE
jgi:hypothetical protein